MSKNKMKKGEIYKGSKRDRGAAYHYIVYLEKNREDSFIGGVLTHSKMKGNVLMEKGHFMQTNEEGEDFEFQLDDVLPTRLVVKRFIKPQDWGPYIKSGELTESGLEFVESILDEHDPMLWDDYVG